MIYIIVIETHISLTLFFTYAIHFQ